MWSALKYIALEQTRTRSCVEGEGDREKGRWMGSFMKKEDRVCLSRFAVNAIVSQVVNRRGIELIARITLTMGRMKRTGLTDLVTRGEFGAFYAGDSQC